MLALLLAAAATATTATPAPPAMQSAAKPAIVRTKDGRVVGRETTIPFASQQGLYSWTAGPTDSSVYVQDNFGKWYLVKMAGPCMMNNIGIGLAYSTGPTGSFGPFSKIYSTEPPHMSCPVISVTNALPPASHRKDRKEKS
ncbi:hypothetical protein GCM10023219_12310 [Stakelama sediminis]|uniref:Uncharacterized protein n=1 Tax=Stakelama sediminis TaxID=463200 RepID=A0A840YWP4_9SPHN|nr:hypothetical protein [Stakelama sediminis]MBB5717956.1 hypothetical protein [Stakelama sediminis]